MTAQQQEEARWLAAIGVTIKDAAEPPAPKPMVSGERYAYEVDRGDYLVAQVQTLSKDVQQWKSKTFFWRMMAGVYLGLGVVVTAIAAIFATLWYCAGAPLL